jgi:hypothetical protein
MKSRDRNSNRAKMKTFNTTTTSTNLSQRSQYQPPINCNQTYSREGEMKGRIKRETEVLLWSDLPPNASTGLIVGIERKEK